MPCWKLEVGTNVMLGKSQDHPCVYPRQISSGSHHHRVQVTITQYIESFALVDRTSGSAFPAALAFQIRELERETSDDIKLDAIITVVDAQNFSGYEDTSPTAKMQASYSDIILIVSALVEDADSMTFWGFRINGSTLMTEHSTSCLITSIP